MGAVGGQLLIYYMKGKDPLMCPIPSSCSWSLKKILGARELIQQVGGWSNTVLLKENTQLVQFTGNCKVITLKFHGRELSAIIRQVLEASSLPG